MELAKKQDIYTYEDYASWPENERWQILDGVPYMQATPTSKHQKVSGELFLQIGNYLKGKTCDVYSAPFGVRLPEKNKKKDKDILNVVEPDISVICDKSKIDEKGCLGAPDLVIEILSPSSVKLDKIIKFKKYEKAGVKEYWVVDIENRIVEVYRLQGKSKFGKIDIYSEEDKVKVSIFDDLQIDLAEVFKEV